MATSSSASELSTAFHLDKKYEAMEVHLLEIRTLSVENRNQPSVRRPRLPVWTSVPTHHGTEDDVLTDPGGKEFDISFTP